MMNQVVAQGFCQCCKFDGSTTTTKSKLNKKSTSKKLPKVPKAAKPPRQQFYYEDLSDEDVYNYDIASPSSRESCISICFKSFVLVAIVGSIGFGGLYFHNPTEFWTTMDQVEAYMKPLGKWCATARNTKYNIFFNQCHLGFDTQTHCCSQCMD